MVHNQEIQPRHYDDVALSTERSTVQRRNRDGSLTTDFHSHLSDDMAGDADCTRFMNFRNAVGAALALLRNKCHSLGFAAHADNPETHRMRAGATAEQPKMMDDPGFPAENATDAEKTQNKKDRKKCDELFAVRTAGITQESRPNCRR